MALGIDPYETAAGSLAITPLGAGFAVRWQGVKILSRSEVLAALEAAANRTHGSDR
jgi:hypothetical protein